MARTHIQTRLRKQCINEMRQRMSLYNDKRVNPSRSYNNYKYLHTQHWGALIYKANINGTKRRNK